MPIATGVLALCLSALPTEGSTNPQERRREMEAQAYFQEGLRRLSSEDFEEAEEEFKAALRIDPLLVLAHYGLGQTYMAMRRYPDAVVAYFDCKEAYLKAAADQHGRTLEGQSRREDQIRGMRDTIRELRGRLNQPLSDVRRARIMAQIQNLEGAIDGVGRLRGRDFHPSEVPAEFSLALGSAFFRAGQLDEAEHEYRAAVKVNPKYGEAHNNLAVIYMMAGRLDEAERHMKLAEKTGLRVNPDLKEELKKRQGR